MVTLFSIPKAFAGHIGTIQQNALRSWRLLMPTAEILLFGDEAGTADMAAEIGATHLPTIACNDFGTPLLNSVFSAAERHGRLDHLLYTNADMIFTDSLTTSLASFRSRSSYLMVGGRSELELTGVLDFEGSWQEELLSRVARESPAPRATAIDFFAFRRGTFSDVPPFAIGRTCWDNWLIHRARSLGIDVIDCTRSLVAIHQNHDYSHHIDGAAGIWNGDEARRNLELAGGSQFLFTLDEATHETTSRGGIRRKSSGSLQRRLKIAIALRPKLAALRTFASQLSNSLGPAPPREGSHDRSRASTPPRTKRRRSRGHP